MSEYKPGVYVKGDDVKRANTVSRAVALVFEGYKLRTEDEASEPAAPVAEPVTETAPVTDEAPAESSPTPRALARRRPSQEDNDQ